MASEPTMGIILLSGAHDRAHAAFSMAAAAAALGRDVIMFGTGAGCRAFLADWSSLRDVGRDAVIRRRGVAGFGELREATFELGVRLLVCESGLKAEALDGEKLAPGVEIAGMATLLEATFNGQIVSF